MNREAKRFVALNAVLHGHNILKVFDDSLPEMADCLGLSEEAAATLATNLNKLQQDPIETDRMVGTFLNYFRNATYAFVAMEKHPITLETFVQSDLDGQITDDLRVLFLKQIIRDVTRGDQFVDPCIKDGVLYCTHEDFERAEKCMLKAYALYKDGPTGTTKQLAKLLRKHTSMQYYTGMGDKECAKVLMLIERAGVNPTAYQNTLLMTPDLFGTYKLLGAVMSFVDSSEEGVYWLLDAADNGEDCYMATVSMSAVNELIESGKGKLNDVVGIVSGSNVTPSRKR